MKNKVQCFDGALGGLSWVNDTGAAVAAGTPVLIKGRYGIAFDDIAAGASGVVQMAGIFKIPCAVDADFVFGDSAWWNGSAVQSNSQGPAPLGVVVEDQPTDDSQAWVKVMVGPGYQGSVYQLHRSVTAGEDTANSMDVTIPGLAANANIVSCKLVNGSGVVRHPTVSLNPGGVLPHVIRLSDANLATTDTLHFYCTY